MPGPYNNPLAAYVTGKIAALNATDRFVQEKKPSFSVINIMPGFVFGRDHKALTVEEITHGTNRILLPVITGATAPFPMAVGMAHVDDMTKVHLLALKEGVEGDFGVTTEHVFDDAWDVVKKHFPKAVESGTFSQGHQPNEPVKWNASATEEYFGFTFKSYEETVKDVVEQYLEYSGKDIWRKPEINTCVSPGRKYACELFICFGFLKWVRKYYRVILDMQVVQICCDVFWYLCKWQTEVFGMRTPVSPWWLGMGYHNAEVDFCLSKPKINLIWVLCHAVKHHSPPDVHSRKNNRLRGRSESGQLNRYRLAR